MFDSLKNGMLLAMQFFSVIPVRRELPMEKRDVTAMYGALPLLGLVFGAVVAVPLLAMREFTDTGSLLMAFVVVLFSVFMTGGLHLDGLADTGDAYFSHRDRDRRFAIMEDPRIGAFGVMVLLFAIVGKIAVVAETVQEVPLVFIVLIPFVSRIVLLLLFTSTDSAKQTGLAAFFQLHTDKGKLRICAIVYAVLALLAIGFFLNWFFAAAVAVALAIFTILYRKWCMKHFGGMTGDLFGAAVEGVELLLWIVLLLYI